MKKGAELLSIANIVHYRGLYSYMPWPYFKCMPAACPWQTVTDRGRLESLFETMSYNLHPSGGYT